jgi:hypothetical protein
VHTGSIPVVASNSTEFKGAFARHEDNVRVPAMVPCLNRASNFGVDETLLVKLIASLG